MKEFFGIVLVVILIVLGVTALGWFGTANQLAMYQFFGIKFEDTRREIFEHSKAFRQGTVQDLLAMQADYVRATPDQKDALGTIILMRAADFDENVMPPSLRGFIQNLRQGRGLAQ